MKRIFTKLINDEKGYGTIELLILVAAIGVLATALMGSLKETLTGSGGSVDAVGNGIKDIVGEWVEAGD